MESKRIMSEEAPTHPGIALLARGLSLYKHTDQTLYIAGARSGHLHPLGEFCENERCGVDKGTTLLMIAHEAELRRFLADEIAADVRWNPHTQGLDFDVIVIGDDGRPALADEE